MVPPITFNRYFKVDEESKRFSQDANLNVQQRAVYGNVVIKVSLKNGPYYQTVAIKIEKSNTKAAFVTMELNVFKYKETFTSYVSRGKWIRKDFKDWAHTCTINDITVQGVEQIRKGLYILRINVELKIYWHGHIIKQISPNLFDNIKNYMNKPEFSDVKVCVKGKKEYLAHKIILAAQSPMLERMLKNMKETQKNCIRFPGIDGNIDDELMMFLYQGKLVETKKKL